MKHISWFLVVVSLAFGCGRDKKAWAHKIDKLVERAYACQDVACAKQVEEEMGAIVSGDEGRNLDEGEPEFMFSSAKRIRGRVAELQYGAAPKPASAMTRAEVFETAMDMCLLAFDPARPAAKKVRVAASLAKVGAALPEAPSGMTVKDALGWMNAAMRAFTVASEGRLVDEDALLYLVGHNLCVTARLYSPVDAKLYVKIAKEIEDATRLSKLDTEITREVVAGLRSGAEADSVIETAKIAAQKILASGAKRTEK